MPEYFDISLIIKKSNSAKSDMEICINKLGLSEGENRIEIFDNRKIIVTYFEEEEADFNEISVGFPEQIFHRTTFEQELKFFTNFANSCFLCNSEIQFALCSYELNSFLLEDIKKLSDFNDAFLSKFPITYKRVSELEQPLLIVNLEAQNIW